MLARCRGLRCEVGPASNWEWRFYIDPKTGAVVTKDTPGAVLEDEVLRPNFKNLKSVGGVFAIMMKKLDDGSYTGRKATPLRRRR